MKAHFTAKQISTSLTIGLASVLIVASGCKGPAAPTGSVRPRPARIAETPAPGTIMALPSARVARLTEPVIGSNLLTNGGFEVDQDGNPVGWKLDVPDGYTVAVTQDYSSEGSHALRVDANGRAPVDASEVVTVVPRKTYVFRAMALVKGGGESYLEVRGDRGGIARSGGLKDPAPDWSLQTVEVTAPPFATKLEFALRSMPGPAGETATAWFDECELYQLDRKNYIPNASFEDPDLPDRAPTWFANDQSAVEVSDVGFTGRHSLRLKAVDWPTNVTCFVPETELAGKTICARIMIKASKRSGAAQAPATVEIQYRAAGKEHRVNADCPGGGQWTEVTVRADIPKDIEACPILLRVRRAPAAEGPVLMDDAILEIVGKASATETNGAK